MARPAHYVFFMDGFVSLRRVIAAGLVLIVSSWSCAANLGPELVKPLPSQSLGRSGAVLPVDLAGYLRDPDVTGTAVRVSVRMAAQTQTIDLALYDQQTPLTVANFLAYINAGRYANSFIHRSAPGFVIQGGGYYFVNDTSLDAVPKYAAVANEPGISNVRGTIAMAKIGGQPNSATSEWFINLANNAANLDAQNGGFTVFGRVVGAGMVVADQVAALPYYDTTVSPFLLPWDSLPLTAPSLARSSFVETNMAVIPALSYAVTSSNTAAVTASVVNGVLRLTPSAVNTGTSTISLTTTDLDGATLNSSFTVTVLDTYAAWQTGKPFANGADALATADPDGDGSSNLLEYAFGGDPLAAAVIPGQPAPEAGGGVVFYQKTNSALLYTVEVSTDLKTWTTVWQSTDGLANAAVFAHSSVSGFDVITIRQFPVGNQPARRFWRVKVTITL
jgi:cyclophilin family peptidyl-prolyl cis-trans isomerase